MEKLGQQQEIGEDHRFLQVQLLDSVDVVQQEQEAAGNDTGQKRPPRQPKGGNRQQGSRQQIQPDAGRRQLTRKVVVQVNGQPHGGGNEDREAGHCQYPVDDLKGHYS